MPKPDAQRQRRNKRATMTLADGARIVMPSPPEGLLKVTRDRWATYWQSELARAARDAHLPIIERLFIRYDERERAYRAVRRQGRVTKGSKGQWVAHPLLRYIDACDAEIRQLEDRLGLSPRMMATLGSAFAAAEKSLDDLNQSMETDDEDNDDNGEAVDPRLEVAS